MARYTGPITKKSRRLKLDLVGGDKNFELRPFPPGQHGRRRIQHVGVVRRQVARLLRLVARPFRHAAVCARAIVRCAQVISARREESNQEAAVGGEARGGKIVTGLARRTGDEHGRAAGARVIPRKGQHPFGAQNRGRQG